MIQEIFSSSKTAAAAEVKNTWSFAFAIGVKA
jgi:hypothetical protein